MTKKHLFNRPKTCLPHEIAQRYLFGVISASKNLCNLLLKICAICGKNLRNLRLIKDLRAYIALYTCKETFTDVMKTLQIGPICTNKPNFRKSQMNITKVLIRDYDKKSLGQLGKTNPIQTQYKPNSKPIKAKTNPIQTQNKPNFTLLLFIPP